MFMKKLACIAIIVSGLTQPLGAQAGVKVPQTEPSRALNSLVSRFERDLHAVVLAMPADRFNFRPTSAMLPGSRYDGVRSFSEEVKHLAWANYATVSGLTGKDPKVTRASIDALANRDDILRCLDDSFAEVHAALAGITVQNENDSVEDVGVDGEQSRFSLAAWIPVHGYDHYGQLVEYLRMNGLVPPSGTVQSSAPGK